MSFWDSLAGVFGDPGVSSPVGGGSQTGSSPPQSQLPNPLPVNSGQAADELKQGHAQLQAENDVLQGWDSATQGWRRRFD